MELFLRGTIVAIKKESFKDKQTGEAVDFFKYTIATEEGDTLTLNSKKDLAEVKNKSSIIFLGAREIAGGHKLSLVGVKPQED